MPVRRFLALSSRSLTLAIAEYALLCDPSLLPEPTCTAEEFTKQSCWCQPDHVFARYFEFSRHFIGDKHCQTRGGFKAQCCRSCSQTFWRACSLRRHLREHPACAKAPTNVLDPRVRGWFEEWNPSVDPNTIITA